MPRTDGADRTGSANDLYQLVRQIINESGTMVGLDTTVDKALLGVGEIHFLSGSSNPDVTQSALFFQFFLVKQTSAVSEEIFFGANNKYKIKLQPFSGVHRHHCYGIIGGIDIINVRNKSHFF